MPVVESVDGETTSFKTLDLSRDGWVIGERTSSSIDHYRLIPVEQVAHINVEKGEMDRVDLPGE